MQCVHAGSSRHSAEAPYRTRQSQGYKGKRGKLSAQDRLSPERAFTIFQLISPKK